MQLKSFSATEQRAAQDFEPKDITAIYSLRAHAGNPWILDRIDLLASHYDPAPQVLICDFGSEAEFAEIVADKCRQYGFHHIYVDDKDVFSLSAARNRAFEASTTPLVFFCDVDIFGRATLFSELANTASAIGMKTTLDLFLNLPIFHLSEADTARCTSSLDACARSRTMDRIAVEYLHRAKNASDNAFVVPYSNNFLMHRNLFDLVGGYDERFRGHGSEDFEFFVRLHFYSKHMPFPRDMLSDRYSPMRDDFYRQKEYAGFRRLFEAQSYTAETFGLRVFHLWHHRNNGDWTDNNDWRREKLKSAFDAYTRSEHKLLAIDNLKRSKQSICVCKHHEHWGYLAPLRLAGYRIIPLFDDAEQTLAEAVEGIKAKSIDAFAVYNPYMKSHAPFKTLFLLTQDAGLKTIVVERGALPGTIYYADDVSYTSEAFGQDAFDDATFTPAELLASSQYVDGLRTGNSTLEKQDSYEVTAARYPGLTDLNRPICFIPTQLDDDMAVTHFVRKAQSYAEFVDGLPSVIDDNPDILFIVKPHPLSRLADMVSKSNLIVARREDNIHFLIDAATCVVCYNSGAGLLSLLHGKPTITIGNAFYNYDGAGHRASSLEDAIETMRSNPVPPPPDMIRKLAAWFRLRKYSTFIATDDVKTFERRKAHGYKDIMVTHFRLDDTDLAVGRLREIMPLSSRSYLWARVAMEPVAKTTPVKANAKPLDHSHWGYSKKAVHTLSMLILSPMMPDVDRRRLRSNPIDFFTKAKWWPNRFFGRLLLDKSQRPY